ncbi:dihydrodipicolinate synthase family protein [Paenibacillus aceris]|uniref:4-hydroxy-tetrahydrodipicolinate synthase n=1 Tax=Paenibacillus aceris TaxID=869555 RepID=A0ABS4HW69_9BACL|nr:dihydrodipicolinate synthase family protein [Paenibacillus aceris]MBP1962894.1 4-hydroxy-tetrahydrodipicolinate synthase [Paenibacillus aceris]NHW38321.1 dihydrodipicolinate synthase family protein [Paenibacillus aceris]
MAVNMPRGVWPTMVTPFTDTGKVDYGALEQLIEWYIDQGVHGLFAVCQSSEMFYLTLEERVDLARFVTNQAAGRVPVIASGHISDLFEEQVAEIQQVAETGVQAVVLVSNRLAGPEESDDIWFERLLKLLERVPSVPMGIYECPYPYKRLLSPQLLKRCADTGRFAFLKDTSCDLEQIAAKIEAVKGSSLQIFNANSATLLASLRMGAAGFSGVMANFHPDIYVSLTEEWSAEPAAADMLQSFVGAASLIELQMYPVNAKYHLRRRGLPISLHCRSKDASAFRENHKLEVEQLDAMYRLMKRELAEMI